MMKSFFTDSKYSAIRHGAISLAAILVVGVAQFMTKIDFGEYNIVILPVMAGLIRLLTPVAQR